MLTITGISRQAIAARPASALATSDEDLVRAISAGDRNAMQALYARHNVRVYRFILRLTNDTSLAEDLASEVFIDVWRRAASFKEKSQVSTWLLAIARYKALSALRRRPDEQLDERAAVAIEDPADDAETLVDNRNRSDIVRKCLMQLSAVHREVIDLVYYHEKTVEEVAGIVGTPASTVKTRMFYARQRLGRLLEAAGLDGI